MKELYKALAAFQQEVPHIYKGTEGYGYSYADWGQILDVVNPLMEKHGLGFTQLLNDTKLKTVVFHSESGESIESSVDIPQDVSLAKMNTFQVMGSAITYYKRYALSAMLGLVTDADKDAAGEQVKQRPFLDEKTKEIGKQLRNRTEEVAKGPEAFNEEADTLGRAKIAINEQMEKQGYVLPAQKTAVIVNAIGKKTIDNLNDAYAVADALDNLKEENE